MQVIMWRRKKGVCSAEGKAGRIIGKHEQSVSGGLYNKKPFWNANENTTELENIWTEYQTTVYMISIKQNWTN